MKYLLLFLPLFTFAQFDDEPKQRIEIDSMMKIPTLKELYQLHLESAENQDRAGNNLKTAGGLFIGAVGLMAAGAGVIAATSVNANPSYIPGGIVMGIGGAFSIAGMVELILAGNKLQGRYKRHSDLELH